MTSCSARAAEPRWFATLSGRLGGPRRSGARPAHAASPCGSAASAGRARQPLEEGAAVDRAGDAAHDVVVNTPLLQTLHVAVHLQSPIKR